MTQKISVIIILTLILVAGGCKKQPAADSIEALEAKFREATSASNGNHDEIRQVMTDLADAYEKFARDNPTDPNSAEYLYKAAELHETNMMNISKSMAIFDKIIADYPESERAADALFKKGYVLHNTLKNIDQARVVYLDFLKKYPNHELAASARFEIDNLGVDARDLLDKIQQKADSAGQANAADE
ncbi:MAG: tetratricopeptide repeat protein [Bacteroidia bacterium]|nr:tetratricopeptide repeat protein [Bacteroidia bacterium]